jgi:pimeloyl-ACP methyl ester carboxylesterase
VDVGGVELYYEETGSGPATVLVHGIPTDYRAWEAQASPFSVGRRVFVLSRRYAWPNDRTGDVSDSTVQNNADDLSSFIEKVVGGPATLIGHSYGGFICAFMAVQRPDLVKTLVLVEPAISTLLVADQSSSAQLLGLLLKSPSVALSGRRFQGGSLGPSLRALRSGDAARAVELNVDGVQDERGSFTRMPEGARKMMMDNARTISELGTVFPRFAATDARKISCPTLVVNGEETALWLRKIGELMAKAVPDARLEKVKRARHFPHMENPEEFNARVLGFLGGGR